MTMNFTPKISEEQMETRHKEAEVSSWESIKRPAPTGEPVVRVKNLMKRFRRNDGTEVTAINDLSFDVYPGESVVLLGPSGCGKTTLLRCIAGLEDPDGGEIEVNGRTVFSSERGINVRSELRQLSMVFQSYALWPHMTIMDNIAYPLMSLPRATRPPKSEITERVLKIMATVGIAGLEKQYPNAISGGQQQRVALCRALIAGTSMVLFDEPLSNVDAQVRERLRDELIDMQRAFNFASLFVTHDRQEAMVLADRIAVLNGGVIRQLDRPARTYRRPKDRFVARFIGPTNELDVTAFSAVGPNDEAVGATELGQVHGLMRAEAGDKLVAFWRPEAGTLSEGEPATANRWKCTVERANFYGSEIEFTVKIGDRLLRVLAHGGRVLPVGTSAWMSVEPRDVQFLADR
ncbi:ABC transporter ATP-binding protein [Aminobacter sp. AP02]|uniref:ABC transporter ATP-binding protein n=1 Tax=Aminobacter sp. AP02 TaxID=2135737 RepID=UPI000D7B59B3|nr:ABC transporter ATP-binding protein [Aminobacter sp. AP02]PWK61292.1 iron(III) transport system ATP-binding protein [Aminobacter sp. AP02]